MTNKKIAIVSWICIFPLLLWSQAPVKHNTAEIHQLLKKLNVLGSVMYVAAHPDDENTQMISYFANEKLFRTAYFSATRGDGGQNLVGPEIRELLGVIRTQELLAARRIDGGEQMFSRANDFGFSKHPDETFNIWEKEKVMSDLVWSIRKFRPDIIITRFSLEPGITHGHHTASAMLANEAFELAGDAKAFPEQLQWVEPWQPKRIFWNTSWWFYRNTGRKMDTTGLVPVNVGAYNPLLGKSYTEISALSRSMHKSQGFGATGRRGTEIEYLKQWKGSQVTNDPFDNISTDWSRINGGEKVAIHTENALFNFDPQQPWLVVPDLIKAAKALETIEDDFWKEIKRNEITTLIKACLGLFVEAKSTTASIVPGDSLQMTLEVINRSPIDVKLTAIRMQGVPYNPQSLAQQLKNNQAFNLDLAVAVPQNKPYSQPYWLAKEGTLGMYRVDAQELIGLPENDPAVSVALTVVVNGHFFDINVPLIYKKNDPVQGEVYEPLVVTPPVFLNITDKVYVMANGKPKNIVVRVIAGKDRVSGQLSLQLPEGWSSVPASQEVTLSAKDEEQEISFMVTPTVEQSEGNVQVIFSIGNSKYEMARTVIDYNHIPKQTLFPKATAKVANIDLTKKGEKIGYIMGAGDEIPASLRQIGYDVWEMKDEDITEENLATLDAVIMGIRAYNTQERLKLHQPKLLSYVENGGTMIVQYNTASRLVTNQLAPYPLKLSRDRVTVEDAPVTILQPDHPVMNFPNKITEKDFEGWVQERGLYFPDEWDENFTAILSSNDPGETPKNGGLLVAPYGEGYYIYTGYSWFRELPAGVPGAYRLFTNLISVGKN